MSRSNILARLFAASSCPPIGGQAVMDGVMMRNGDVYGLAVRLGNGEIRAQRLPWRVFLSRPWLRLPFVRGFPILLETLANGVHALNRSAALVEENRSSALSISFSVILALLMAVALFVVAPHMLSLLMLALGLGGDVDGFSFHLWDGFFKCAVFVAYIRAISLVPEIRRVFEYHGAEHKVIHAWETGEGVGADTAFFMSRLHPRCGTTFLLFVICISIIIQALVVPLCLHFWTPGSPIIKHLWTIAIKLALIAPVSAAAYELIRFAANLPQGFWRDALQAPGLMLQKLTTREPSPEQLEVAVVALAEALDSEDAGLAHPVEYVHVENSIDACLDANWER